MTVQLGATARDSGSCGGDLGPSGCQAHRVLDLIDGKWSVDVLLALKHGPVRHGQLRRAIGGVSQKMLTQTLRDLERARLVSREVRESTVTTVEYSLAPAGHSLLALLRQMHDWAVENISRPAYTT
ncbi:helix-turn-helix transcriptional regulator [Allokutzneria sp. A3M-2-11 16]|uniref:winged helix-turn-helix transcriptional regulator n=1 Tax=Allokutzneria sp. A3M-2-11 16 TaxID=2962043 RepID=UPI0020B77543|nr:helix-turn-helix domain-containing protein [Allokutzneria sp. A3M-2-11 16]MCP3804853.1 helix-turn-helix transcriptional regulator [Allokutzneria sp. A3M-2-11 16]